MSILKTLTFYKYNVLSLMGLHLKHITGYYGQFNFSHLIIINVKSVNQYRLWLVWMKNSLTRGSH